MTNSATQKLFAVFGAGAAIFMLISGIGDMMAQHYYYGAIDFLGVAFWGIATYLFAKK